MAQQNIKDITNLAETRWEGCHGCDENDRSFWINGFVSGYLEKEPQDNKERSIQQTDKQRLYDAFKAGSANAITAMRGLNGMSFEQYYNMTYGTE
jgi:hypothetical protein